MDTKKNINCPACGNGLTKIKAGRITVDACVNGCGGIWFDKFELHELNEPKEKEGEKLLGIQRNPNISVDKNARHNCPVCNIDMFNYELKLGMSFVIDECPECGGYWLDGGEFEKIRYNSGIAGKIVSDTTIKNSEHKKSILTKIQEFVAAF